MARSIKRWLVLASIFCGVLALSAVLMIGPSRVVATALEFLVQNQGTLSVTATTTVSFMTPGTATTTYYYDSYASGAANTYAADNATLAIQFNASSTNSTLNWIYEYAHSVTTDCVATPTKCDWYVDDQVGITNASSTGTTALTNPVKYMWAYASTSPGAGVIPATANSGLKIVTVPMPTRYVRAIFTLPSGSTNGSVWAAFISKKQSTP